MVVVGVEVVVVVVVVGGVPEAAVEGWLFLLMVGLKTTGVAELFNTEFPWESTSST